MPIDYRKFLGAQPSVIAPYVGSATIATADRILRVGTRPPKHGWYRFEIKAREAVAPTPVDAPDLSALPRVCGWLLGNRLIHDQAKVELVALMPDEEPPRLSPVTARRWHSGELLYESIDFETEAEGAVREAIAEGKAFTDLKSVPSGLRAAGAFALLERASRMLNIPFAFSELRLKTGTVADGGLDAAQAVLRALDEEREQTRREVEALERERAAHLAAEELEALRRERAEQVERFRAAQRYVQGTAELALEKAGATLESERRLNDVQLEVVFAFMGERFISIVDARTLQVIDSGICLGHPPSDDLVTLESLPSVIKEAIEEGSLVILRHA